MNYLLQILSATVILAGAKPQAPTLEEFSYQIKIESPGSSILFSQESDRTFELEDFDFWAGQCVLLNDQQQYTEALAACERSIALRPRRDNVDLWAARGNALLYLGRYADSIASYRQVVEASPNHSLAIASQCAGLFQLNRYEDAIDTCEQALSIDGNWGNVSPAFAWYYRGLALRQLGRLETALSSFERAIAVDVTSLPSLAERCEILTELAQFNEISANCNPSAITTDRAASASEIEQCGALSESDRAGQFIINQALQTTVLCYKRALTKDSQNVAFWVQQGLALEQLGQYERAVTAYGRAIELNPNHAIASIHHCGVLNQLQNYETALATCDRAFQIEGGLATWKAAYGWNQRSVALIGLQRYDEALAAANQAIEIEQRYAPAWNSRALSLWWLNQSGAEDAIDQAIAKYEEAKVSLQETFERAYPDPLITIHRGHILALNNRGRMLAALGKHEQAVQAGYRQAIDLENKARRDDQMSPIDRKTLSEIWANQAAAYLHFNFLEAINSTQRALTLDRNSFAGWYNRGLAFANLNNAECAFDAYSEASQINPNNIHALMGQGLALEQLGAMQEAIARFDRVLSFDSGNTMAQQHREATVARLWTASANDALQAAPRLPVAECRRGLVGQ